jgi:hypothetical protein
MAYVSRSPPIIPDGQISRVRFETSAFLPKAFPKLAEGLNAGPYTPPAILVCPQPRLLLRHGATPVFIKPAAIRPRRPPSVLSLFAQLRCYLHWGDVPHLLRGRYPSVIAPTGSCATPIGLSPASVSSLVRRVFAGCTQSLLPTGASRRYL